VSPWIAVGIGLLVVAFLGYLVAARRRLTRLRGAVVAAWRRIDGELRRRHDLLGTLIGTITRTARFEESALRRIQQIRARAMATRGSGPKETGPAERALSDAVRAFLAVAANYPELPADRDFVFVRQQLAETDDRIADGVRVYNTAARTYNTRLRRFPSALVRGRYARANNVQIYEDGWAMP
jgi:LemA protein